MSKQKYIETPEKMWELFEEYRKDLESKPMARIEYVGKEGDRVSTPLQLPTTFEGFECYLADQGIIQDLGDYSSDKGGRYKEYATIITRIRNNCFVHNYNGAAVGLFNANLVARKLGLVDKKDVNETKNINILNIDPLSEADDSTKKDSPTPKKD